MHIISVYYLLILNSTHFLCNHKRYCLDSRNENIFKSDPYNNYDANCNAKI